MRRSFPPASFLALPLLLVGGCGGAAPASGTPSSAAVPTITNRIPLPPEVVANLGVSFAKAKRGRLESRLRVPGRVEIAPEARFTLRAPVAGRIVIRSTRWQPVKHGDVVAEILSPDLRLAQEAIADTEAAVARLDIELVRARADAQPLAELARSVDVALAAARTRATAAQTALDDATALEAAARTRIDSMQSLATSSGLASGLVYAARKDHVDAQAAALEAALRRDGANRSLAELGLELARARAQADTSALEIAILEQRRQQTLASSRQLLRSLAVLTGTTYETLMASTSGIRGWVGLESVPVRAPADGTVVEISASDGEWVEATTPLFRLVDPTRMVFRGELPEADVASIPPHAEVRLEIGCVECADVETRLEAARPLADPRTRTVLVEARIPGDASAYTDGSSATAAVLISRSAADEVLVPERCVVQDELEFLVFRRDPGNPNQVIRAAVSLGRRSDGWVEILTEVAEGDEVVRDGAYQLRLSGNGKAPANGHFHADGTWHEGKD